MEYITLNELCEYLSISSATAKNWIKLKKIKPVFSENSEPFFSKDYLKNLKKDISNGEKKYLKSRRNKKYISGSLFYKDYISKTSKNISTISNILETVSDLTENQIQFLVAECALQLMNKTTLLQYINSGCENRLIEDLIFDKKMAFDFIQKNPELFNFKYVYEENEDILGLLYISLSNIGIRKSRGAYFTPTKIVKKLVEKLDIKQNNTVFDPCCGTGNFLLQLNNSNLSNIYGNDIDETSVRITRLNLFLKYKPQNIDILYSNITSNNFLYEQNKKYDYIIGNPPWGSEFSDVEKNKLRKYFNSAVGKNIESYDIFVEKSINNLNKNGELGFVLPEAILNVKTHKPIRKIIKKSCELVYLEYLGNVFDGVHCPSIILQLKYTGNLMSCMGAEIKDTKRNFVINSEREITSEQFDFLCDDAEYKILKKLCENKLYLKSNADFALGIVTGNNEEFISNKKLDNNEVVIKGSDIFKYGLNSSNYISFEPEKYQQVAPENMYRAKEKLLYRFIGKNLVFAYDNQQRLSLNSCNVLIPKIKNYSIKYIMAILNSTIAQFVFSKKFNSIKVLRSHIENIPIPFCDKNDQLEIISMVDKLLTMPDNTDLYELLDKKISKLYGLSENEHKLIKIYSI